MNSHDRSSFAFFRHAFAPCRIGRTMLAATGLITVAALAGGVSADDDAPSVDQRPYTEYSGNDAAQAARIKYAAWDQYVHGEPRSRHGGDEGFGASPDLSGDGAAGILPEVPVGPGDLNADGFVDFSDLVHVLESWGVCSDTAICAGDANASGIVDFDDLMIVLANWSADDLAD